MKGVLPALAVTLAFVASGSPIHAAPYFDSIKTDPTTVEETLVRPPLPEVSIVAVPATEPEEDGGATAPLPIEIGRWEQAAEGSVPAPAHRATPTVDELTGTPTDALPRFDPAISQAIGNALGWRVDVPTRPTVRYVSLLASQVETLPPDGDIPLPEPASIILLTIGLATAMLGLLARRRLRPIHKTRGVEVELEMFSYAQDW